MSSEVSISIRGVAKRYDLFDSPGQRMRSLLLGPSKSARAFNALLPLDLDIAKGEFFGIIGQNGSGKSTLLQLIAGILQPSEGSVEVHGKIAALLELGAGFNPEFTGLENARLNAQILGISGAEFERVLPDIEAFADIGEFIQRPVKTYSSGMFVRLAFAVQACIDPDILIIDEALAVGDIFFRLKCYERIERLRKLGCTVILVTHSVEDVVHYCDRALLLHQGEALFLGNSADAVNRYYTLNNLESGFAGDASTAPPEEPTEQPSVQIAEHLSWPEHAPGRSMSDQSAAGDGRVRCLRTALVDSSGQPQVIFRQKETMSLFVEYEILAALDAPVAGLVIRTERGVVVHGRNSGQAGSAVPERVAGGSHLVARFDVELSISPGEYVLDLGFATWPMALLERAHQTSMAELEASSQRHNVLSAALSFSVVPQGQLGFSAQPFYGLTDLNSQITVGLTKAG